MKRILGTFLSVICCLMLIPSIALAGNINQKVTFQQNETKDIGTLIDRAQKGISDWKIDQGKTVRENAVVTNVENKEVVKPKSYITSQHLKTIKYDNGDTVDTYVRTTITPATIGSNAVASTPTVITSNRVTPMTSVGPYGGTKWDPSVSIAVTTYAYYDQYNYNGHVYVRPTKTSTSWYIGDSQVSIPSKSVSMGVIGEGLNGFLLTQHQTWYPSGNYLNSVPSPSLPYINYVSNFGGDISDCGTSIHTYCLRGTTHWDFWVSNKILGPSDF